MYKHVFFIIISLFLFACNNTTESEKANYDNPANSDILKKAGVEAIIEVYNIHTSSQDSTSIQVGTYSQKAVDRYFSKEKDRGVVKFIDLAFEDASNNEIIKKFEITNPGLYIVCKKQDKESIENLTDFAFLTAVDEPEMLMQAVKTNIDDKLKLNK